MSDQTMFPEKDLIDMSFMDHIKFNSLVPTSKLEVDKAIQEHNCLVAKMKEISKSYEKRQRDLADKFLRLEEKADEAKENILLGIESCINNATMDIGVDYEDGKCEINFEHGKLLIEQTTTTKFKIKPIKEN